MTTSEQIRVLCVRSGVSLSELARRINQTPQNFSVKLKRNTVTQDEPPNADQHIPYVPEAFVELFLTMH